MPPHKRALALVYGLFALLLGFFAVLGTARNVLESRDTMATIWVRIAKVLSNAPGWAFLLIALGIVSLGWFAFDPLLAYARRRVGLDTEQEQQPQETRTKGAPLNVNALRPVPASSPS